MKIKQQSVGKEKAIALGKSGWWKGLPARDVAKFQLLTQELCMDFGDFHKALEESLGRPVFTHEIGLNFDGIVHEFFGERDAPTFQEVVDLIPADRRFILGTAHP